MIDGTLAATPPALALAALYSAVAFMLLSLHLKSAWRWHVKSTAIGLTLPATLGAFLTVEAQLGWPSRSSIPANFQLHAVLVHEPTPGSSERGAIFLWLTPWTEPSAAVEVETAGHAAPAERRPRAYNLPYSRELHQEIDEMRERLARGEMVVGRHQRTGSLERRFGRYDSQIELNAPPPPTLPPKEG